MEKILHNVNYHFCPSSEQTVLMEAVGAVEPQTLWLNCIPNAALLSLKLLQSAGQNNSSEELLHDLFLNEDFNISIMTFYSQPCVEHTCWVKKELLI